jgi:ribosomal protein S18 acetylase RimI-like enzyme
MTTIEIRMLGAHEADLLADVAPDVFDEDVHIAWRDEFVGDDRHHMAVALDGGRVVGFASGVHYLHPDKPPELFINEAGVAEAYQSRGIGRQLMAKLLAHATTLGCNTAWVLTDTDNSAARRIYAAAGGTELPERPVLIEFTL